MAPVDLYAIGAGNYARQHVTQEGMHALSACQSVFFFSEVPGLEALLERHGIRGHDLSGLAEFAAPRAATYEKVAARVLEEARQAPPVAWVAQGNPALICGVTSLLRRKSKSLGLRFRLIVAPSSIDTILADLAIEMAGGGLQVLDAALLATGQLHPQPTLPCLLLQLARAETLLNPFDARLRPHALQGLQERLLDVYPPAHPCKLVTSNRAEEGDSTIRAFPLRRLSLMAGHVTPWTSLFLRPCKPLQRRPARTFRNLKSYEHFERLFEMPLSTLG